MPQTAKKENIEPEELQGEFVSGGGYLTTATLSLDSLDTTRPNLTPPVRRRLRYDSEIESSVEFLFDAVFAEGIQAVPVITDDEDPEFDEAQNIADFVRAATCDPFQPRSLEAVVREIARGAYYSGVKAGEIVLKLDDDDRLILDRINPKPNSAVSFVCDRFYNVLGLASWNSRNLSAKALEEKKDEIIPREKFLILQFELEDNDPRGVAKIRAAYDDWCEKKKAREQYTEWRRTSAIPKKVGITPQGARPRQIFDSSGNPVIEQGRPKTVSAEEDLMTALEGFANNSTVTAPFGTEIKQLEVGGNGEQFTKSLKFSNSGIRKAILGDSVSTGEDDKGVKAAKEVAIDVVDLRVKSFKNIIAEAVRRDVYRLLTIVNFGADKAHLTPRCSLGDTERRDWAQDLRAASLAGYGFAPEHLAEIDAQFGLKPRAERHAQIAAGAGGADETDSMDTSEGEGE